MAEPIQEMGGEVTLYRYAWRNNAKRAEMFGRMCRVVARGKLGSVLVEFADNGQREVTSRRALRRTFQPEHMCVEILPGVRAHVARNIDEPTLEALRVLARAAFGESGNPGGALDSKLSPTGGPVTGL